MSFPGLSMGLLAVALIIHTIAEAYLPLLVTTTRDSGLRIGFYPSSDSRLRVATQWCDRFINLGLAILDDWTRSKR